MSDAERPLPQPDTTLPPRVLVVDAEAAVHEAARQAAAALAAAGRPVALLHAHDAGQGLAIVRREPALAVALVGIDNAPDDAGRRLVRLLRHRLGRHDLQLILGTPPGATPSRDSVRRFGIDDFRARGELTRQRMGVCLAAALRRHQIGEAVRQGRAAIAAERGHLARAKCGLRTARRLRTEAQRRVTAAHDMLASQVESRTQALSQAVAEAGEVNRRVAHDLRGPLYGIAGLAGLVDGRLERGDTAQVRAWAALVGRQSQRLVELVDGLATLSEITHGPARLSASDLGVLVQEAREQLVRSGAWPAHVRFESGPMPTLQVDASQMRALFAALLSNAAKFSRDQASPAVRVRARAGDGQWIVEVHDNGIGFAPADRPRLFELLRRCAPPEYDGLGIGLATARRIAQRHGGDITADGRPNEGAVFRVTLPADPR